MKKPTRLLLVIPAFFFALVLLQAADRPNFVFFITDDISAEDLGPYGNTVAKTPNLDRIASEGLVFDKAYLTTSSCSPSRCSIITGRYPHNTGAPELHIPLPEDQVTVAQKLRDAGYYTLISGKNHMNDPDKIGFVKGSDGGKPSGSEDWVQLLSERPKDKPFFAWFGSNDAHRDWQLNELSPPYDPDDIKVPPYLYDGPKTRQDLAEYFSEVSRSDYYAGKLIEELKRQGVANNTYFIYTADNGRPFPRDKTRLYDSGVKAPLIMWNPGSIKPGRTDAMASSIDLASTFMDLAGVNPGPTFLGVSLAPVLKNPKAKVRDYVFSEHNWHVYAAHERAVRFGDWLYIHNAFNHKAALSTESDESKFPAALELWEKYRAGETLPWQEDVPLEPRPQVELFNAKADPSQLINLAGDPQFKAIQRKLAAVLSQWSRETGDTVPANPSPDRGATRPKGGDTRGELPGETTGADKINHPGPVLENLTSKSAG